MRTPSLLQPLSLFLCLATLLCTLAGRAHAQTQPGLFPNPTVIPTIGGWPAAIYTADINNDGFPDLLYIEHGATLNQGAAHIMLNDGHGNFTPGATFGVFGQTLALGDFIGNGDTLPVSLLITPPGNNGCTGYVIYLAEVLIQPSGTPYGTVGFNICSAGTAAPVIGNLVAARLHGSSAPSDVIFTDSANNLLYTVNLHGNGTYNAGAATSFSIPLPDGAGPITFADVNADGKLDLAVTASNAVDVFLGNGDGTLQALHRYATGLPIHSLLLQDVNLDGRPDLIAEGINGRIDVFPGNGDGTFSTTSIGGTGALDGATGNGGHLIALNQLAPVAGQPAQLQALTASPIGISSLLGQNSAYLGLKGIYNAGPGRTSYATADFNHDGSLDLAVDSPEGIAILFGNPDGSFQTNQAFAAGRPAVSTTLGAFTSSGHLDVMVPYDVGAAEPLLNQGDGTFLPGTSIQTGTLPPYGAQFNTKITQTVLTADTITMGYTELLFTADGPNAVLRAQTSPGLTYELSRSNGTFNKPVIIGAGSSSLSPACTQYPPPFDGVSVAADFIGNGLSEVATRSADGVRVLNGYGSLASTNVSTIPDNSPTCDLHAHQQIAAGSFGITSRPDLIVQRNGSLLLFANDGSGNFTTKALGDFSVDGSLTTPGQLTAPDLSATFGGPSTALGGNYALASMFVADLDGDGNQDLLVLYHNTASDPTAPSAATPNYLYVWYGSGAGKFLTSAAHPVNPVRITPSRNFYQLAVATLNSFSKPVLLMSDGYLLSVGPLGTESHYLAGQGINSISIGDLRASGKQDVVVANGGLTLASPIANHDTFTPNLDVNTGGITVLLNEPTPAAPTPTATLTAQVTASPEPSYPGQAFTLTDTLTPSTGSPTPTGNVVFTVDNTTSINSSLTNGVATTAGPTTLTVGTHTITAVYSGDTNYATLTTAASHTVVLAPTTTVLTPTTPLTIFYGQAADGTFSVNVLNATYPATGLYTLLDNGIPTAICTALPIRTTCPYGNPVFLDAGAHAFTIQYLGDASNAPSLSAPVTYTILPDLTSITLATSPAPTAPQGSAVQLTATLTGNVDTPLGPVTFFDGAIPLGTAPSAAGKATLLVSTLALGPHALTATYPGTLDFNPATSAPVPLTITAVPATLASVLRLTASINPSAPNEPVTLNASVTVPGVFPIIATGTVTFTLDGTPLGAPIPLDNFSSATYAIATMTPGAHTLGATYSGSAQTGSPKPPAPPQPPITPKATASSALTILPSSATLAQTVTYPLVTATPGFLLSVSPVPVSLGVGRTANLIVTITPIGTFAQPVQLSCTGLPQESTCTFFGPTVSAKGGANALQLATSAPHDCGDPGNPYFLGLNSPNTPTPLGKTLTGISLAALVLLGIRWRKRPTRLTAALLFGALTLALTAISGCGHCTDLGTRPGNYTFTVNATAQGGPVTETQSQTIQLTVTIP